MKVGNKRGEVGNGFVCDWAYLLKGKEIDVIQSDDSMELSTDATEPTKSIASLGLQHSWVRQSPRGIQCLLYQPQS